MSTFTNEMIDQFWTSVDDVRKDDEVCWDTVMWDMFFAFPEMENDKKLLRDLHKLIDSVESMMRS
jgi:hypothetical protein